MNRIVPQPHMSERKLRRPALGDAILQRQLTDLNHRRLSPALPESEPTEDRALLQREAEFIAAKRREVSVQAALAPRDADGFVRWFEALKETGPGQGDPLFPWLADHAPKDAMIWFLTQEVAGEAGFDDLVALTQVKMPARAKLELARNYWDEMGRGNERGMHGGMLDTLAQSLALRPTLESTVVESLELANMMVALAVNRRFAYHAIGALGVIELTAPGRSAHVAAGLKRLGVPADDRHYFDLHAVLDVKHSIAWNAEIVHPLVSADPRVASAIAEGALMRLTCGARCFERYRKQFGLAGGADMEIIPDQTRPDVPTRPNLRR